MPLKYFAGHDTRPVIIIRCGRTLRSSAASGIPTSLEHPAASREAKTARARANGAGSLPGPCNRETGASRILFSCAPAVSLRSTYQRARGLSIGPSLGTRKTVTASICAASPGFPPRSGDRSRASCARWDRLTTGRSAVVGHGALRDYRENFHWNLQHIVPGFRGLRGGGGTNSHHFRSSVASRSGP